MYPTQLPTPGRPTILPMLVVWPAKLGFVLGEPSVMVNVHSSTHFRYSVDDVVDPLNTVTLNNPSNGVATTGGPAPTPVGSNVQVSLPGLKAVFEEVIEGGFTINDCTEFMDPRDADQNVGVRLCSGEEDGCPALGNDEQVDLDFPRRIPPNIRAFDKAGEPTFVFCQVSGNITTAGVIEWTNQASVDAGFEALTCADKPKLLWGADFVSEADERFLVEGADFVDITMGCINPRKGGSTRRSGMLPLAVDTLPRKAKLDSQINNLETVLGIYGPDDAEFIPQDLFDSLSAAINGAKNAKGVRKKLEALNSFKNIADANKDNLTTNVSGDLRLRPRRAMWMICDNFFKKKPGECNLIDFDF